MARPIRILILSGALLLGAMLLLGYLASSLSRREAPLPVLRETHDFALTNQAGQAVGPASLRGRPYAVNLIFTRCPGPCRQSSGVMRRIAAGLPAGSRAGLLSLTSDPEFDTPSVLARYAATFGADGVRWQFLTGSRETLRRLATEDLLMVLVDKPVGERDGPDDLFLHSTLVVLVDGRGRVRAAVEGLEAGAVERVLGMLAQLEREGGG